MDAATNRRQWGSRSGEYSPSYYAHLGANNASRSLVRILDAFLPGKEAAVFEVGCSSGRHLAHLLDQGYENLHGIDINGESFEVMAEHFPDLADTGSFRTGAIEAILPDLPDDAYDVVYSVETLQHVHEDDTWVFEELARITGELLVTIENEGDGDRPDPPEDGVRYVNDEFPIYFRDWGEVFAAHGLEPKLTHSGKLDTIRVFEQPNGT